MTDPNRVRAEFGDGQYDARITALEGQGGLMRVRLGGSAHPLQPGQEGVLEMHDGARFRVRVLEQLGVSEDGHEYRMRLAGKD